MKYFVSNDYDQYCILKEDFDTIAGNFCSTVLAGIDDIRDAQEICDALNSSYIEGKNDVTAESIVLPIEQFELLKASFLFLQEDTDAVISNSSAIDDSVSHFLKQIRNNSLSIYVVEHTFDFSTSVYHFVVFASSTEEAESLFKIKFDSPSTKIKNTFLL